MEQNVIKALGLDGNLDRLVLRLVPIRRMVGHLLGIPVPVGKGMSMGMSVVGRVFLGVLGLVRRVGGVQGTQVGSQGEGAVDGGLRIERGREKSQYKWQREISANRGQTYVFGSEVGLEEIPSVGHVRSMNGCEHNIDEL